jgi:hypothetical protein
METCFINLTFNRHIVPFSFLLFILVFANSCKGKLQHKKWDIATVDPTISQRTSFKLLNQENEVFSAFENQDSSAKRTSGVLYFTKGHVNITDSNSAKLNNCRAYFFHGDTLSINIGIGNGFGGWGFIINYREKKFYAEPYYSTDVVIPDEPEPVFNLVYQSLTLDKPVYQVGDSLYGKVSFKSIETDRDGSKIDHSGNGYFRAVVTKL